MILTQAEGWKLSSKAQTNTAVKRNILLVILGGMLKVYQVNSPVI